MAIQPDTVTGTVTFTSGSVNFTTVGTNLQTRGHIPGDWFIHPNGKSLVIETITGQNTGTLRYPAPADCAGSGIAVTIRWQPDGARIAAQSRNLIETIGGSGNLEALAGLTGASNQVPYFTGAGAMASAPFTVFGRSLVGSANQASARTSLGLVPQSNAYDTTANALLTVGAFGLGGVAPRTDTAGLGTDFDLIITPGIWSTTGAYTNGPLSGTHTGVLQVFRRISSVIYQLWYTASNNRIFYRGFTAGSPGGAWTRVDSPDLMTLAVAS